MVERFGSQDPDFDSHNDSYSQDYRVPSRKTSYAYGRPTRDDHGDSVPLFLSDPDGEPDPSEYDYDFEDAEAPPRRMSVSLKVLMAVVAAAGVAMMFAMATSDATRDVIVSAKASISGMRPQAEAAQAAEASPPPQSATTSSAAQARGPVVAMAPTLDDTLAAYQTAVQSRAAPPVPAVASAPPARVVDAEELALLMKRAKDMLSAGDIPSARLLLRRAADAQEPTAALMLAQTYDPAVLGTQDARNIIPDPQTARAWYQKAAELGSTDAQRRLAQMQN